MIKTFRENCFINRERAHLINYSHKQSLIDISIIAFIHSYCVFLQFLIHCLFHMHSQLWSHDAPQVNLFHYFTAFFVVLLVVQYIYWINSYYCKFRNFLLHLFYLEFFKIYFLFRWKIQFHVREKCRIKTFNNTFQSLF